MPADQKPHVLGSVLSLDQPQHESEEEAERKPEQVVNEDLDSPEKVELDLVFHFLDVLFGDD